ncbi:hypothetical protein D0T08_26990 [Emticicia sp. C21]|nr:hypothetical protein D0T08_26990 [Emticicia sp. C21]
MFFWRLEMFEVKFIKQSYIDVTTKVLKIFSKKKQAPMRIVHISASFTLIYKIFNIEYWLSTIFLC